MKQLPILRIETSDFRSFINFWSRLYTYPSESLYKDIIYKEQFNEADLQQLFTWKNGMKLSQLKQNSLDNKIKSKLNLINTLKSNNEVNIVNFRDSFNNVSAVWKIFLLHIIKPNRYPIYDQHVHRAYNFICELDYNTISNTISDKEKEQFYFGAYLEFVDGLTGYNLKNVDEAFFAFGQFLRTNGNAVIFE